MHRLILLLALITPFFSAAQQQANHWYFGNGAGLDFSSGTPVAVAGSMMSSSEGTSAVSDSITGNLLFYTDAINVYNATHGIMPNGMGLLGSNSSSQSAMVVPMPGNTGKFYIFASDGLENNGVNGYTYSVVDMSLDAGRGDITLKNIPLFGPCSEQLAAVKHANCVDWWIMCKGLGNNSYHAYLLTSMGLTGPVISTVGVASGTTSYGQSKFSPDGSRYAISTGNVDMVTGSAANGITQLFDFNNATGLLSNPITIVPPSPPNQDTYGLNFAGNNTKLYVMQGSAASELYQYDISLGSPSAIIASGTLIGTAGYYGQLQLGKDFKIYIADFLLPSLSVINNPNATGAACGLAVNAIPLTGMCSIGLTNFPDSYFNEAGPCVVTPVPMYITATGTNPPCSNDTNGVAMVQVLNNQGPYTATWQPGGLTGDTIPNLAPGTYIVTVTDSAGNTATDTVMITAPPALIAAIAPAGDTLCAGTGVTLTAIATGGTPVYHYQWNTAASDTVAVVSIMPAATVNVGLTATDNKGCTASDSIWVYVMPAAIVQAPADTCVCAGETISLTATGAPNYVWNTGDTTATISYTPAATGWLVVTYQAGLCTSRDSVRVCVYPTPVLSVSPNDTSITGGNSIPLVAWSSEPVTWSPPYYLSCTACANPIASPENSIIYTVTATNAFGCTVQEQVSINVDYDLLPPNIITPNGDGVNDVFKISRLPEGSSLAIMNRWGQTVYETAAYANNWNTETDGVYFYILKIPAGKVFTGHIQVSGSR